MLSQPRLKIERKTSLSWEEKNNNKRTMISSYELHGGVQLYAYYGASIFLILSLGIVGNTLAIVVLLQPEHRTKSMTGLMINLCVAGEDLSTQSLICKFHFYFLLSRSCFYNWALYFCSKWGIARTSSENVTSRFCNISQLFTSRYAFKICSNYPGIKLKPAPLG